MTLLWELRRDDVYGLAGTLGESWEVEAELCGMQALREAEREHARTSLADQQRHDIEYLKNTVLKLYETGRAFCAPITLKRHQTAPKSSL